MTTDLPILYSVGAVPFIAIGEALIEDFRIVFNNTFIGNSVRDVGGQVALLDDAIDLALLSQAQTTSLWLYHKVASELLQGKLAALNLEYPALHTPKIQEWMPNAVYEPILFALSRIMATTKIIEEHGINGSTST